MQLCRRVKSIFLFAACARKPDVIGFVLSRGKGPHGVASVASRVYRPLAPEGIPTRRSCDIACWATAKIEDPDNAWTDPQGRSTDAIISSNRRRHLFASSFASVLIGAPPRVSGMTVPGGVVVQVADPDTYSALSYSPAAEVGGAKLPLIVVLPGAGRNDRDAWDLADSNGEHRGLAPSLLASGRAPPELARNFAVVTPYAAGRRSFYEEPRRRILQFVDWVCSEQGRRAGCPDVDPSRIFLFGFSDGATLGVELATSGRFRGGVFAAYGFTGELPALALERLRDLPIWVFHCADDVIFPVACSDRLVKSLKRVSTKDVVRYTRYDKDQEGFTGSVRGHSSGITASKQSEIYSWMLSL